MSYKYMQSIPDELWAKAKLQCAVEGRPINVLVRYILTQYLAQCMHKPPEFNRFVPQPVEIPKD